MLRNAIKVFLLIFSLDVCIAIDLSINDDIEIPAICHHLPEATSPVDLSAACLSAQIAAETFPPLLPAANRLCLILEGTTAWVGVLQHRVNLAHEVCDSALAELENTVVSGITEYNALFTDLPSLLDKLSGVSSADDLYDESVLSEYEILGLSVNEWTLILDDENDDSQNFVNHNFFQKIAGSKYLGSQQFNARTQMSIVEDLQSRISETITLKESQDLQVRMAAELSYQKNVFMQLMAELLEIESANAMKETSQQRWYHNLTRKRENQQ